MLVLPCSQGGNWEEEGRQWEGMGAPGHTYPTLGVAGLSPSQGASLEEARGLEEDLGGEAAWAPALLSLPFIPAFFCLSIIFQAPPSPLQGSHQHGPCSARCPFSHTSSLPSPIFLSLCPAHLNLSLTPEPQKQSQVPQEDQADQPQGTGQPPGSHSSTPFSHMLQEERPSRSVAEVGGRRPSPNPGHQLQLFRRQAARLLQLFVHKAGALGEGRAVYHGGGAQGV